MWSWVSVDVFPLNHVDDVVLGICECLSAKSSR